MAPSLLLDSTAPISFGDEFCANCSVEFATLANEDGLLDKHVEYSTPRPSSKRTTNLEALRTVFKLEFQLNYHFADGVEINKTIPMCTKCTQALGNLHRFHAEFYKLTSELSPLCEMLRRTLTWIDKYPELRKTMDVSSQTFASENSDIDQVEQILRHVKTEPVEDVKILPDIPDFNEEADYDDPADFLGVDFDAGGCSESDDEWVLPGSRKRCKAKVKGSSDKSKRKVAKTEESITLTRSKTVGLKNVTVSIEPLDLNSLVSKEQASQPGEAEESESLATRKTYLINKQQLRRNKQNLRNRKRKAKRLVKIKTKVCSLCSKAFKDGHSLTKHMLAHSDERKFQCSECSVSFKERKSLKRHMNVSHGVGGVLPDRTCELCGKYFSLPSVLRNHIKTVHTTERPFCCEICGRSFPTLAYLNIHKKMTHEYSHSFQCDQCEKVLSSKHGLKTHIETVHLKDLKFQCPKCPRRFYRPYYLEDHMQIHEENRERNLSCRFCDAKFMERKCLAAHERKHKMTNDKLCTECGASFKNKSSLRRHIESRHTDGVEYKCELCSKVFKVKEYLMQHMRSKTHGGLGHYSERLKMEQRHELYPN